jgi:hypothetical protein
MMRGRLTGLVVVVLVAAAASPASAQSSSSAPHTGGFSPFRAKGFAGSEFTARSLEQEGCPLEVAVASAGRDERGVTLTVEVRNASQAAVSSHVIGVWVLGPDGTLRGSQQSKSSKALAAGGSGHVDVVLRMVPVQMGDTVVVAVQEVAGGAAWRKDKKTLQDEVRTAFQTPK